MMKTSKEVIYDSAKRGPVALEELRGIFQYRDLILQLVRKDIVARYKRSVLGIAWTMLQPLGMMVILSLVFSTLFKSVEGFPVYILSGLIAWNFFSQTTSFSISQIIWGSTLLRQIYLPRTSFAVSTVGTGLVNLLFSFVPLLLIMLVTGVPLRWSILFVPVSILLLTAFTLGLGLIISTLAIQFPDVAELYGVILMAWMYLTPIVYPESMIPETYRHWLLNLNPMYYLVKVFRMPLFDGLFPDPVTLGIAAGISILTLLVGWVFYARKSDEFAYYV